MKDEDDDAHIALDPFHPCTRIIQNKREKQKGGDLYPQAEIN